MVSVHRSSGTLIDEQVTISFCSTNSTDSPRVDIPRLVSLIYFGLETVDQSNSPTATCTCVLLCCECQKKEVFATPLHCPIFPNGYALQNPRAKPNQPLERSWRNPPHSVFRNSMIAARCWSVNSGPMTPVLSPLALAPKAWPVLRLPGRAVSRMNSPST